MTTRRTKNQHENRLKNKLSSELLKFSWQLTGILLIKIPNKIKYVIFDTILAQSIPCQCKSRHRLLNRIQLFVGKYFNWKELIHERRSLYSKINLDCGNMPKYVYKWHEKKEKSTKMKWAVATKPYDNNERTVYKGSKLERYSSYENT